MRHITHFITHFPGLSRGSAQRFLSTTRARSTTAYAAVSHSRRRLFATLSPSGTLRRFCAVPIVSFCPASPVSPQAFSTRVHCVPGVPRGAASHVLAATFSSSAHSDGVRRPPLSEHGQALANEFVDKDRIVFGTEPDDIKWRRDKHLDKYAAELLVLHEGSLELEARDEEARQAQEEGDGGDKGKVPKQAPLGLDVGATSSNGRVTHVGHGVFIEDNTLGIDADSVKYPKTITRKESRDVARYAIDLLQVTTNRWSKVVPTGLARVAVVGHPGIGKTRGGLAYTLQELLWRGEVVMRVGYKMGDVHLFVPDEEGQYRVWCSADTDIWAKSVLAGDVRTFVLIDPPEAQARMYSDACGARMIKFASNNEDKHYRNFYKDGHLVFTSMPTVEEMVAMIPALWTEATPLPGQKLESKEEKEEEVCKRCAAVGCAPRAVFNGELFKKQLRSVLTSSQELTMNVSWHALLRYLGGGYSGGDDAVGSVSSKCFLLEGASADRTMAFVRLSPITCVVLRDDLLKYMRAFDSKSAFEFEQFVPHLMKRQDPAWKLQSRPSSKAETNAAIRALGDEPSDTVVVASSNYPVLDFATSRSDWFNAKAGKDKAKVGASAFVTTVVGLGLARKEDGKLVMLDPSTRIRLTMMRASEVEKPSNSDGSSLQLSRDLSDKHSDLDVDQVQKVFDTHVRMDEEVVSVEHMLQVYKDDVVELWNYFRQCSGDLPEL